MRLALYSNQVSPRLDDFTFEFLKQTKKKNLRIAYLSSCPDSDRRYFNDRKEYYSRFGAEMPVYLDLEDNWTEEGKKRLFSFDAIHLSGGNTFRFLSWLKRRELFHEFAEYVRTGGSVIGISAGAMVLSLSIESSFLKEQIDTFGVSNFDGMELAKLHLFPHFQQSSEFESRAIEFSKAREEPLFCLEDHQVIEIEDNEMRIVNGATEFLSGIKNEIKDNKAVRRISTRSAARNPRL